MSSRRALLTRRGSKVTLTRTSNTTYLVEAVGAVTKANLKFKRLSDGYTQGVNNATLPYTFTHTAGEVWEVSGGLGFVFDNKIRYIRSWGNRNNENEGNHWHEIEAISGGINLALNKPTSVSANATLRQGVNYASDKAVDGSIGTNQYASYSNTDGLPMWLQVDLETIQPIDRIDIKKSLTLGRLYYDCTLQVSNDGNTWITIFDGDILSTELWIETEVKI